MDKALRFYGAILFPKIIDQIHLDVEFVRLDRGFDGFCESVEDEARRPRNFIISLNRNLGTNNILVTAAHEMVHVKQYATGKLFDYACWPASVWNGKVFNLERVRYWDRPWEIEAEGLQRALFFRYKETLP